MRRFLLEDLADVNCWLRGHSEPEISADILPEFGLIVDQTAAGFFYQTDSKIGLMETFVSNPDALAIDVNAAINLIVETMLGRAREIGCTGIMLTSKTPSIIRKAKQYGFKESLGNWSVLTRRVD